MSSAIGKILIGAAIIGAAFLTGGAALAPVASGTGFLGATLGGGATIFGSVLTTTALGGLALAAGAVEVLSGVMQAVAKTPKVLPSALDRLNASLVPTTPRIMAFGRTALGTDIRYVEPSGTNQEYIDYIIAVASHRVTSIDEIWMEDAQAWTATGGVQGVYAGYLTVDTVLEGGPSNYIQINDGSKWGSSERLTGCAYIHLRIKRSGTSSPFTGGLNSRMTIIGNGIPLYDPRFDSTIPGGSGPMRAADQSTWSFYQPGTSTPIGNNLALQSLAYLLGWRINSKLAVGRGIPQERLELAGWITAANLCDESVITSTGSQPRYHGAGLISEGDDPSQVLTTLATACNSRFRETLGKLGLVVMHNDLALAATDPGLGDDEMIGGFTWNPDPSLEQTYNVVRGRYTDPSTNSLYQLIDYPEIRLGGPNGVSLDGIDRILTLDLPWCQDPAMAQRLAKQVLERKQYQRSLSAVWNMAGWSYKVGDVVPVTLTALGFNRRLFRVDQQIAGFDGTCPMVLIEENDAIYAWDADDRSPVTPAAPIRYDPLNNPILQAVQEAGTTADWPNVTGIGKPSDNATNSADPNSPFGPNGKTVYDIEAITADAQEKLDDATGSVTLALDRIQAAARQGAPNLITNGNGIFANGIGDWVVGAGLNVAFYDGPSGHFMDTNNTGIATRFWTLDIPISETSAYVVSCEGALDAGGGCVFGLQALNAAKSSELARGTEAGFGGFGVRQSVTIPATAGAAWARIYILVPAGGGVASTRYMLQQGTVATDWRDDASLASAVQKTTLLEGDQAAYAEQLSDLAAALSLPVGSTLQDIIAHVQTTAQAGVDASTSVTQRTTKLESRVGGRQNLVTNGSGENGLSGITGLLTGWNVAPANSPWGTYFGCNATSNGTAALEWSSFEIQVGETYTISADTLLDADTGSVYVDILFQDASGQTVPGGDGPQRPLASHNFSSDGSGKDAIYVNATCPAGAVKGIARFVWQGISGLRAMAVREMQVERGGGSWTAYNQSSQPLYSAVNEQAGTIVDILNNYLAAYLKLSAVAGTQSAEIDLLAQDGSEPYSALIFKAGRFIFSGGDILANTIIASKFLTDQGVDLAATVPYSFNFTLSGSQGMNDVLQPSGTSYGPYAQAGSPIFNGHRITLTGGGLYIGGGTPTDPVQVYVDLYINNGGGWQYVGNIELINNYGGTNFHAFQTHIVNDRIGNYGASQLALFFNVQGDQQVQIVNPSWNTEMTFWK